MIVFNVLDSEVTGSSEHAQQLVTCLQAFEAVCSSFSHLLQRKVIGENSVFLLIYILLRDAHFCCRLQLLSYLPHVTSCLSHRFAAVRHMAARALGELSRSQTDDVMEFVIERILPLLGASDVVTKRQGAIEALSRKTAKRTDFDVSVVKTVKC